MKTLHLATGLTAACLLAGCATTAPMYPTPEAWSLAQDEPVKRTITGSRIPRMIDPDAPSKATVFPLAIISEEEIDRMAPGALGDLLRRRGIRH